MIKKSTCSRKKVLTSGPHSDKLRLRSAVKNKPRAKPRSSHSTNRAYTIFENSLINFLTTSANFAIIYILRSKQKHGL